MIACRKKSRKLRNGNVNKSSIPGKKLPISRKRIRHLKCEKKIIAEVVFATFEIRDDVKNSKLEKLL